MGTMRYEITFEAPLEDVWQLFIDAERWSQWNTEWAEIRDVRSPFDHPGAGYTQVMRFAGRERLGTWEVAACEPRSWREVRGRLPLGIAFEGRDTFTPEQGGTRVVLELSWKTPLGPIGRLLELAMRPVLDRQFRKNAAKAARLLRS